MDRHTFHIAHARQRGSALLAALIILGTTSLAFAALNVVLVRQAKTTAVIRDAGEKADIKRFIRARVHCLSTVAHVGTRCPAGFIDLRDEALGSFPVVPSSGKTLGKWEIRARCLTVDPARLEMTIDIEARKTTRSEPFRSLYTTVPFVCRYTPEQFAYLQSKGL